MASKTGRPVTVTAVSARDQSKDRGFDATGFTWFTDPVEMAKEADIDIFVELIGGTAVPLKTVCARRFHVVCMWSRPTRHSWPNTVSTWRNWRKPTRSA